MKIEFPADPGIHGRISHLGGGQDIPGPVGTLGPLRDPETEENGGEPPEPVILDLHLPGQVAEIDETGLLEGSQLLELPDIIVQGGPGLDDVRRLEDGPEGTGEFQVAKLEKIDASRSGKLDQRGRIGLPLLERGPRLRIETQDLLPAKTLEGRFHLLLRADHMDGPLKTADRQGVDLLPGHPPVEAGTAR